jgi:hypothetical protein
MGIFNVLPIYVAAPPVPVVVSESIVGRSHVLSADKLYVTPLMVMV